MPEDSHRRLLIFIAYEATDADALFRERKISYVEGSTLAPATNQGRKNCLEVLQFKSHQSVLGER